MIPRKYWFIFFVIIAAAASYWRVVTFTFWKDDWWLLWAATHQLSALRDWLHPGTPIEFILASPVFGAHAVPWQLTGILLHIAVALALVLFVQVLTGSTFAAKLSGILYGASFAGMDAVGWPSAHVVLWASLFLIVGLYYFIRYIGQHKHPLLWISLLYMGIALVFDPFRILPVFLLLPLITHIHNKSSVPRVLRAEAFALIISLALLVPVLGYHIYGSQLVTHLTDPSTIFTHINVIGNYFNSIANLFLSWLIRFPEDVSTGVYNPFWARSGFFIFCLTVGAGYEYFKRSRKSAGVTLLLLLWIFVFYVPNWLFEPRLTMGGTHRYMVISAIGFIALMGYMLSLIRNRTVGLAVAAFFVIVNIVTANHFSSAASAYRSFTVVNTFWKAVDAEVPENLTNLIFVFSGEDPVKTYGLSLSGGYPFALKRGTTEAKDIPVTTEDPQVMDNMICQKNVPLNHVFAWNVTNGGSISDESLALRRKLLIAAMDHDCVPIIDSALLPESK